MSIWLHAKDQSVLNRVQDEKLHEVALNELRSGIRRDGLWAKALVASSGDKSVVTAEYLKLRVASLRDEMYLSERAQSDLIERSERLEGGLWPKVRAWLISN